ncbi:MAG TPA: RidA family protein [Candidatus Dormibacteraeota bacterium]|jgi:enamine deaminase RidA (YjgF/YER057c/UK114 family)
MSVDDRLAELGIALPATTAPVANYVSTRRTGNLLFVSGHVCRRDGAIVSGKVGDDIDTQTGYDLARLAALDVLGTVRAALGSLDDVTFVKITGFVNSAPGFTDQPAVINGASDLFVQVLGNERGAHARSAIGVAQLPLGAAVEVEAILEVGSGSAPNR